MALFQDLYDSVMKPILSLADTSDRLIDVVTPFIALSLIVKIMWQGMNIIRGQGGSNHLLDVFMNNIKASLVIFIGLTAGHYKEYVLSIFDEKDAGNFAHTFIKAFNPDAPASPVASVDDAFNAGFDVFTTLCDWGFDHIHISLHLTWPVFFSNISIDVRGIPVLLTALVYILFLAILCVFAFADILANAMGLLIIFGVGPVFIGLYAFEATQHFFHTWLSAVLKWSFSTAIIAILCWMAATIFKSYLKDHGIDDGAGFDDIMAASAQLIISLIALGIITGRAGQLAADIIGGTPLSGMTQATGGAATYAAKRLGGGALGMVGASGRGVGRLLGIGGASKAAGETKSLGAKAVQAASAAKKLN